MIVAAAEILLQPYIQTDEEIAAAHFPDFQLGLPVAAISPCDGRDRPRIASYNGLQGQFHSEIEMRRNERPAPIDHGLSIGFECVRRIIQSYSEEHFEKQICQAIQQ